MRFTSLQSLSRVRLCDPMNRSTPGLPVHHQLPESGTFHSNSPSRKPSFPKTGCTWNQSWTWRSTATLWTLSTTTTWPLAPPIHKTQGAVNDSCCQKRSYGRYCRHKFQTQLTFKKPIVTGKFSSHPLNKKKEKTPNGHGTRYSTSLFITGGIPIKMTTSSQIPS